MKHFNTISLSLFIFILANTNSAFLKGDGSITLVPEQSTTKISAPLQAPGSKDCEKSVPVDNSQQKAVVAENSENMPLDLNENPEYLNKDQNDNFATDENSAFRNAKNYPLNIASPGKECASKVNNDIPCIGKNQIPENFDCDGDVDDIPIEDDGSYDYTMGRDQFGMKINPIPIISTADDKLISIPIQNTYPGQQIAKIQQAAPIQAADQIQSAPIQSAPIQSAPIQSAPIQRVPIESVPIQGAPIQSAPIQSAPIQSAPVQSAPVQSAPIQQIQQIAPIQSAPIQQIQQAAPIKQTAQVQQIGVKLQKDQGANTAALSANATRINTVPEINATSNSNSSYLNYNLIMIITSLLFCALF